MTQADSVHSTPPTNTSANNPSGTPRDPQDSLFLPTDIAPEELFLAIGRLRKDARDEIDRLLQFLDETENHMSVDDEDGGDDERGGDDELSLGSQDAVTNQAAAWKHPTDYHFGDCEVDDSDDEPSEDDEPSIGFDTEPVEQDTGNDEPSLGWTVDGCTTGGTGKGRYEVEVDLEMGDGARR